MTKKFWPRAHFRARILFLKIKFTRKSRKYAIFDVRQEYSTRARKCARAQNFFQIWKLHKILYLLHTFNTSISSKFMKEHCRWIKNKMKNFGFKKKKVRKFSIFFEFWSKYRFLVKNIDFSKILQKLQIELKSSIFEILTKEKSCRGIFYYFFR